MAPKFSVKKAGGFSLGTGCSEEPVFSDDGQRFAARIVNRVQVWDLATRSQVSTCKSAGLTYPGGLALNHDASRLALRNGTGLIDVLDVATGERINRIQGGEGYSFNLALSPDGRKVIHASSDSQARLFIWDADTGRLLERHDCSFDFMPTSLSHTPAGLAVACFMAKADAEERGLTDFLWVWTEQRLYKIETGLNESLAAVAPDGKRIFVAGRRKPKGLVARLLDRAARRRSGNTVFRLLDLSGAVLAEKDMGQLMTFPLDSPVWSADGGQLVWHTSVLDHEAWLLDAATLELRQKMVWPHIKVAFGPQDWMALAGDGGMVLPRTAMEQAIAQIGQPAAERAHQEFKAYKMAIEARRAARLGFGAGLQGNAE